MVRIDWYRIERWLDRHALRVLIAVALAVLLFLVVRSEAQRLEILGDLTVRDRANI